MSLLRKVNGQLWLQGGSGGGVATLTGNRTLSGASAHFQVLTPSGADRSVLLPSIEGSNAFGQWYRIKSAAASGGYSLFVKDADSNLLATLAPGQSCLVVAYRSSGSNSWSVVETLGQAVDLAVTGAFAAVAATFTGRVTTTDGVSSGDARVVGGNIHTKITSTALTNSSTETTLGSHSVPANEIKSGTTLRFKASLRITNVASSATLTIKIKLGSTAIATWSGLAVATGDYLIIEGDIIGRAPPGASASVVAWAKAIGLLGGLDSPGKSAVNAPANYATNGALTFAITGQWSAANASSCKIGRAHV